MNNQGFFLYHSDNGVDVRKLMEHAYYFPQAVAASTLQPVEKARQYGVTLQPPASMIYAKVLTEQLANQVDDLEDILKAYSTVHIAVPKHFIMPLSELATTS